jgi:hypothetical protein
VEEKQKIHSRPWWEAYVFTVGVIVAMAAFLATCNLFLSVPYADHVFFALMAVASLYGAVRRPTKDSSPVANILLAVLFGLASSVHLSRSQLVLGTGYAGLTILWLLSFIRALITQRQARRERLAKLDRVIDVLRRTSQRGD